ncbi:MAG: hypothetical protein JO283_12190 [Bradyrhizobium sp.]|nr:hypothetical protein [Bradyrhizobium sp.]
MKRLSLMQRGYLMGPATRPSQTSTTINRFEPGVDEGWLYVRAHAASKTRTVA